MSGPFFVARRMFLRQRREKSGGHPLLGASLGIALSLVPIVTVDHVADGMIEGIIARYRETSSFHLQIHSWGESTKSEWEETAAELENQTDISGSWIERQGFGLARGTSAREGITLRALPPDLLIRDPRFAEYLEFDSGGWELDTADSILLGREVARRLDVSLGNDLRVLTARRLPDGRYVPKVTRFVVRGVFSTGYQDLDRSWSIIPLEAGWDVLSTESSRTFVAAKIDDPNMQLAEIRNRVAASLSSRYLVYDWRELNRFLLENLESTRSILLFLMAFIILVAVLNVVSSLIMLTIERRKEIGILKCAGASPSAVTRIFLLAGMLASFTGTIIGLAGGLLVARYVNQIIRGIERIIGFVTGLFSQGSPPPQLLSEAYYLQYIPIDIRWGPTAIIGLVTLGLSILAGTLPASRAAALKPLEVLRKH